MINLNSYFIFIGNQSRVTFLRWLLYLNFPNFCVLAREGELRQLRKQTTELEEQNAILSKHIESMKHAIEKLEIEAVQQRSTNMALQGHLDNLRTTLTDNFNSVPLPGEWGDLLLNVCGKLQESGFLSCIILHIHGSELRCMYKADRIILKRTWTLGSICQTSI